MLDNNRNFLLAIALSIAVLLGWQLFFGIPQMQEERERLGMTERTEDVRPVPGAPTGEAHPVPGAPPMIPTQDEHGTWSLPESLPDGLSDLARPFADATGIGRPQVAPAQPDAPPAGQLDPAAPFAQQQPGATGLPQAPDAAATIQTAARINIDTPSLRGSISTQGGRIDDLILRNYQQTVEPDSPPVTLLSPSGTEHAYYVEHGWVPEAGQTVNLPGPDTVWTPLSHRPLTPRTPVTLVWDNGEGLQFRRIVSVDENYMFHVRQEVQNDGDSQVRLYPYAAVSRHERPQIEGFFILHEGLIGVLGADGLEEINYDSVIEETAAYSDVQGGWLGITDKYWAAVVVPDQNTTYQARFSGSDGPAGERFQVDYLAEGINISPGARVSVDGHVFAGAKETHVVDAYAANLNIDRFDLMIDWGWFYFLTKPLFHALDFFYRLVGNFGVSILIVTVLIKLVLFPLANKSYVAMSRMKKLQPEMMRIKERYENDKMRQQQAMMDLYKREKVNPASGCLPILIQIPVFFALYKVLYVTIEMRHAPFFGWIRDLSAPDPTSLFNLFGLIPWDPPTFLVVGIWPIIMGATMWVQMQLNPAPPDPIQAKIFKWMPLFFVFLLAPFPAGLVIYWAWNNLLSVIQQYYIMKGQGVDVALWDNLGLGSGPKPSPQGPADAGADANTDADTAAKPKARAKRASGGGSGSRSGGGSGPRPRPRPNGARAKARARTGAKSKRTRGDTDT